MHLTIIRHGRAIDRAEWVGTDADRPLTPEGRKRTTAVVRACRELVIADEIWTSPWLRARQTADILATEYGLPVRPMPELAGDATDNERRIALLADYATHDLVLVGHEPDCSDLALALLGGGRLMLKKAGIICLRGSPERGGMHLTELLSPRAVLGGER